MYGRPELSWRNSAEGYALHCEGRSGALLHVVPDGKYPNMWRIRSLTGRFSDMTNLSRAKDAAASVALGEVNASGGERRATDRRTEPFLPEAA